VSFVRTFINYIPEESFVHRLDPATKIIVMFTLSIQALATAEPISAAAIFVVSMLFFLAAKLPLNVLRKTLGLWIGTIVIIWLAYSYSYSGVGTVLWRYSWIHFTDYSVLLALTVMFRLFSVVTLAMLLYCSTTQRDIITGLRKLGVPYLITFVFALAIRTLSVLYDDYGRIREAQMARALEMNKGSFPERVKKHVYLIAPLIVMALNRIEAMSNSIESRAFRIRFGHRTFYYVTHMRIVDYFISIFFIAETSVFLVLRSAFGYFTVSWLLSIAPHFVLLI